MTNLFQTPFVPQQPLLKVEGEHRKAESFNLTLVFSLVTFFVTLAVSGGAYFYKQQIEQQNIIAGKELAQKEELFDVTKISTYKNLQSSLSSAKKLADNHTIFSLILNLIEARAAQNIGLTALTFANDGDVATLSLVGQAPSYEAAYFQVETWRNSKPMIKSVDVSALTLQEESGIVDFSVKISIDPKTLGYGQMLARSAPERRNDSATVPAQTLPFDGMISSSTVKTSTTTK